jgi:VanZ family protein
MRLLAAISGLIVYGSLYPFDVAVPENTATAIRDFVSNREFWTSRGDVLGNIGLFVPFGLVGMYGTTRDRQRGRTFALTVGGGLLLALSIQFCQIWIQSRSAVLSDVFWNGVGILAGAAAGVSLRSPLVFRRVRAEPALVLLGLWMLAELAPLVPSIDLAGIRRSLGFALRPWSIDGVEVFVRAAQVVLAGRLLVDVVRSSRVPGALLAMVALVVAGKVLMVELVLTWTILAGLLLGIALVGLLAVHRRPDASSGGVLTLLVLSYGLQALHPFVARSPASFLWVPFASVLDGWMLTNVRALAMDIYVLGGCLWLMRDRGWAALPSTMTLASFALVLEICQIWIDGRTPSSTEPAIAILTGWALAQAPRAIGTLPAPPARSAMV